MLSPREIESVALQVAALVRADRRPDALAIVKESPEVFRPLAEDVRDDREFVLGVMGHTFQSGTDASSRLKKDIELFVQAFNAYFPRPPIAFTTVHDLVFMLEFGKRHFHYFHDITETDVLKKFECPSDRAASEIQRGHDLIHMVKNYGPWLTYNKDNDIVHLRNSCPEFAEFAYEHAHRWAYGERSWKQIGHIW